MRTRLSALAAIATAALLTACASQQPQTNADIARANAGTPTRAPDGALIGPDGRTLYVYSRDVSGSGQSVCVDGCATNWPPLAVAPTAVATGDYTIITRADGSRQWAYRGMPLYYYVKDTRPGERYGDGMGGNWMIVRP